MTCLFTLCFEALWTFACLRLARTLINQTMRKRLRRIQATFTLAPLTLLALRISLVILPGTWPTSRRTVRDVELVVTLLAVLIATYALVYRPVLEASPVSPSSPYQLPAPLRPSFGAAGPSAAAAASPGSPKPRTPVGAAGLFSSPRLRGARLFFLGPKDKGASTHRPTYTVRRRPCFGARGRGRPAASGHAARAADAAAASPRDRLVVARADRVAELARAAVAPPPRSAGSRRVQSRDVVARRRRHARRGAATAHSVGVDDEHDGAADERL